MQASNTPAVESIPTVDSIQPVLAGSELVHPGEPNYYTEGLQPSGWKVIVPTPLIIDSSDCLFAVRLNPFVLTSYLLDDFNKNASSFFKNMYASPIQLMHGVKNPDIKILYQLTPTPHLQRMLCHQRMRGTVNLALRVTANTTMSGSIVVTQLSDCERELNRAKCISGSTAEGFTYNGLEITNQSPFAQSNTISNYALNDLSLVRHFEISTSFSENEKWYDHHWLMQVLDSETDVAKLPPMFRESILLVSPQTDLLSPEAGQITFDLLWDFSHVEYDMPIMPLFPQIPTNSYGIYKVAPGDITKYYSIWKNKVIELKGVKYILPILDEDESQPA